MKKTGEKCRKTGDLMVVETKSKQNKTKQKYEGRGRKDKTPDSLKSPTPG